jgi:hypothetical protein
LVHSGAAADVVENGARFDGGKARRVEEEAGFHTVREDVDDVIGIFGEDIAEAILRNDRHCLIAARLPAEGDHLYVEGLQHFGEAFADGSVSHDEHRLP